MSALSTTARGRMVSAEEAAAAIQNGDVVFIPLVYIGLVLDAIAARRDLTGVTIRLTSPQQRMAWLSAEPSDGGFDIEFQTFIGDLGRLAHDNKLASFIPHLFSTEPKQLERQTECRFPDVFVTRVSRPDAHGYVNFGPIPFNKRLYVKHCRTVIAEIDESFPRFYGDCHVHVSEIDYLVEPPPAPSEATVRARLEAIPEPGRRAALLDLFDSVPRHWLRPYLDRFHRMNPALAARLLGQLPDPDAATKEIAANVAEVVSDGALLQIGVGEPSESLVRAGAFDHARELGLHTEVCAPGWTRLIRAGIMTDASKAFRPGVAVASAWAGSTPEDLDFIADNPRCELHPIDVVLDPRLLGTLDRFHAINSAISVDLTGQINAESVGGPRMINGTGGQPDAHIGAFYSRGGRAITVLPSTALGGSVSRIVPLHDTGAIITIPRYFADTVITEFGVARLYGKNSRERARELIAIAHPDFRAELRQAAEKLFGFKP